MKKVGIIGVGRLGSAIAKGLQEAKDFLVWGGELTSEAAKKASMISGIEVTSDYEKRLKETPTILLAVEPKHVLSVLQQLDQKGLKEDALILSVAAGVSIADLCSAAGKKRRVIRVMSNSPALVKEGMSVICPAPVVFKEDLLLATAIFKSVGQVDIMQEQSIDVITAIVGSGPAFYFKILDAISKAAVSHGLSPDIAARLSSQVMKGAATVYQSGSKTPEDLIAQVATPGGCTMAGLKKLEELNIMEIFDKVIFETTKVASHLGKQGDS